MMILLAAAIAVPIAIIAFIAFASCIIGGRYDDDDTDQLYDDCPWPLIDGPLVPRRNGIHQIQPQNEDI